MRELHVSTASEWRKWLRENHRRKEGVWLVFFKKRTNTASIRYQESVEEALCFGWIDSIIKRIDQATYCRKFTPRKDASRWSRVNIRRVVKLIQEGRMTRFGLAKVNAAKKLGTWKTDPRPALRFDTPPDLAEALARNAAAKLYFESLAPSYRKHFIGWIVTAKRPETRAKRLQESLVLLEKGQRLGLR